MSSVATYLNFSGQTEEAFNFYKSIFGGEFEWFSRQGDMPAMPDMPPMSEENKNLIMHVCLPILGGHKLMGSDMPPEAPAVVQGNNTYISLHPNSREEADRLFAALSEDGKINMPIEDQFWGDYYGACVDKYGVQWMVNFHAE